MLGWMVLIRELMQIFLNRAIKFPGAIVLAESAFRGDLAENGHETGLKTGPSPMSESQLLRFSGNTRHQPYNLRVRRASPFLPKSYYLELE